MGNHNILRHHSQHLTQRSKGKVTEPKTAQNVIFDGRYPLIYSFTVRFTRKGHQTMRNHNILRHHSQHLTQRSKVKVKEPKTAKNVIFDGRYPLISSFTVRFTRKGHQTMRNHNILRHHPQYLTQRSKVKVTEPKTAKNVIFDGRYPLISSFTVRFTRKGNQKMRKHIILRHQSQHFTQRSKVKVTEPKTAKNVIFDGRYPLISSFTVRFTRKGHQKMRNHIILRHHSQNLTQRSKVKVTEPSVE